jgi:hypothetical protein
VPAAWPSPHIIAKPSWIIWRRRVRSELGGAGKEDDPFDLNIILNGRDERLMAPDCLTGLGVPHRDDGRCLVSEEGGKQQAIRRVDTGVVDHAAGSAAEKIAAVTCAGDAAGMSWRNSAAAPATCGVAIEVPLMVAEPVSFPPNADVMSPPGAKRSMHVPKFEYDSRQSL